MEHFHKLVEMSLAGWSISTSSWKFRLFLGAGLDLLVDVIDHLVRQLIL